MSKFLKLTVTFVVLVGSVFSYFYYQHEQHQKIANPISKNIVKMPLKTEKSATKTTTTTQQPKREIASIVYLTAQGLPKGTLSALHSMHATEVYLYVAWGNDAYFHIPANAYGLGEPADSLQKAINTLHENGYPVTAVISSALLNRKHLTDLGKTMDQPNSNIFNPKTFGPYLSQMVQSLTTYNLDGIYVGEPYVDHHVIPTKQQQEEWVSLYQSLNKIIKNKGISSTMILPDLYATGTTVQNESGLPVSFLKITFSLIGLDLENAYQGYTASDLVRFTNAIQKAVKVNHNHPTAIEISIRKGNLKTPIPPSFFQKEVQIASQNKVSTLVILANEWWNSSPYKKQYQSDLSNFLQSKDGLN